MHADLLITNANVLTMDDRRPRATSFAVRDGRFVAIDEIVTASQTFDAGGRTVVPGFHDCHIHLLWHGKNLVGACNLAGATSIGEICDRLRDHARHGDGWIVGIGFDHEKLAERRFPTRAELDRVSPSRPVLIRRSCCHAAVVNSAALALVSDAERATGTDDGLFTEGDIDAFNRRVPAIDDAALDRALLTACEAALATGITSVQTMLDTPEQWATYERVKAKLGGRLPLRVVAMPPQIAAEDWAARGLVTGAGDQWLRVGGAKFFSDGSLGARTALLAEPYADDPTPNLGIRIYPADVLRERVAHVASLGFAICIHAIGDQALRETLDAIEHAIASAPAPSGSGWKHRVEHASICPPDQLERIKALDVSVTLQPQFITSDTWSGERVGPRRAPWVFPFREMLEAGIRVGLSSDCPVETLDTLDCMAAAVGRASWSPTGGLTPTEALRAYTMGSASIANRETEVGSIEVGKFADFVVLSGDPTALDAAAIRELRVESVFVDGRQAK